MKLTFGPEPPVKVSYEAIENMTGLKFPWVQQNDDGSKAFYYGMCPECDNALGLINPFETLSTEPHGRHKLEPVQGFTHDLEKILACSRFKRAARSGLVNGCETAVMTPNGRSVRQIVTENEDLLIGIVTEVTGISPSLTLIRALFRTFFDTPLYLRPTITPGNAPWLLFGALRTRPLHGQIIRTESDTAKAILRKVEAARIGRYSRLEARPRHWIDIRFTLYRHRISGTDPPCETINFMIVSKEGATGDRTLLEKSIRLRPESFLRRIKARENPTPRGSRIINIARAELQQHIAQHPI
ncbi:hypothetical protein [Ruegeria sp.]|uniref:hypothetical protein n=1 Tax=Ruegeria sp. TaxID=1879320 RepID=UPI003B00133A